MTADGAGPPTSGAATAATDDPALHLGPIARLSAHLQSLTELLIRDQVVDPAELQARRAELLQPLVARPPAEASAAPVAPVAQVAGDSSGPAADGTAADLGLIDCLAAVRATALASAPPSWPALGAALDRSLPDPLPPHSAIPLAMTLAAGGRYLDGMPFAVVWTVLTAAVRIIDDLGDDDSPQALHREVGVGRAVNYASALLQLATQLLAALPAAMGRHDLVEEYAAASIDLAAGQDADLLGQVADVAAYVRLVERKTCAGYRFAGYGGARIAGGAPAVLTACRLAGHHVGMVLQLLDDLESARLPGGDLDQGKRTFPIWHGLARVDHPAAAELRARVFGPDPRGDAAAIRALLDQLDAPRSVLVAAVEERRLALAALARCPDPAGHDLLSSYFDFIFRDTAALLSPRR